MNRSCFPVACRPIETASLALIAGTRDRVAIFTFGRKLAFAYSTNRVIFSHNADILRLRCSL